MKFLIFLLLLTNAQAAEDTKSKWAVVRGAQYVWNSLPNIRGYLPGCSRVRCCRRSKPEAPKAQEMTVNPGFMKVNSDQGRKEAIENIQRKELKNRLYRQVEKYSSQHFFRRENYFALKSMVSLLFSWGAAVPVHVMVSSVVNRLNGWPVELTDPGAETSQGQLIVNLTILHTHIYLMPLFYVPLHRFLWEYLPKKLGCIKTRGIDSRDRDPSKRYKMISKMARFIIAVGDAGPAVYTWSQTLNDTLLDKIGSVSFLPFLITQVSENMSKSGRITDMAQSLKRSKGTKLIRKGEKEDCERGQQYLRDADEKTLDLIKKHHSDEVSRVFNYQSYIVNYEDQFDVLENKKIEMIPALFSGAIAGISAYSFFSSFYFSYEVLGPVLSTAFAVLLTPARVGGRMLALYEYTRDIGKMINCAVHKKRENHTNKPLLRGAFSLLDLIEAPFYGSYMMDTAMLAFGVTGISWGNFFNKLSLWQQISISCLVLAEGAYQHSVFKEWRNMLITALSKPPPISIKDEDRWYFNGCLVCCISGSSKSVESIRTYILLKGEEHMNILDGSSDAFIEYWNKKKYLLKDKANV